MVVDQFLALLRAQSPTEVGRTFAVSRQTVYRWLDGTRKPSRTVLLLAALVWGGAPDLPAGLPGADPKKPG